MPLKTITLPINGMTCPSCSASVERLIDTLEGVESRTISHETDSGVITFDPSVLSESEVISKINEGHYKVNIEVEDEPMFSFVGVIPECPVCRKQGQLVPNTVLRSNVKIDSKQKIDIEIDNHICMNPDCEVAYYNANGTISKEELKRELWYKKGAERVIACYCNNIDTDQINDAIVDHNLSTWEEITSHYRVKVIEKCETLNPTGYCCRNTFNGLVREIKSTI